MKESFLGYWLILFGVFVVVIMLLVRNTTANNTEDYYTIKQISDSAMIDAIDFGYYREFGELKINKEKFMESFIRRFADAISGANGYKILFTGIYEAPPKASVEVTSKTEKFLIGSDSTELDMVNRINSILELGSGEAINGSGNSSSSGEPQNDISSPPASVNPSIPTSPIEPDDDVEQTEDNKCTDTPTVKFTSTVRGFSLVNGYSKYSKVYSDKTLKTATGVTVISDSEPFTIIGYNTGSNDVWYIKTKDGSCGWVNATYMAIAMKDYLPEGSNNIKYNIFNASSSHYQIGGYNLDETGAPSVVNGEGIPNIYGKQLYSSDYNNYVPLAWPMAKKIKSIVDKLGSGYVLEINDAYRLSKIASYYYNTNIVKSSGQWYSKYYNSIVKPKGTGFNDSFFLAKTLSAHNTGCAVDITLAGKESQMPTKMHELSYYAAYYKTTSKGNNNLALRVKNSTAAQELHNIMMNGTGLTDLASEWWHYQLSNGCHNTIKTEYMDGSTVNKNKVSNLFTSSYTESEYNSHCLNAQC